MTRPDDSAASPEARVVALLAETFEHGARSGPGARGVVRRLVERATLAVRHRQYHVDVALLQAIHDLERRRSSDLDALRAELRVAFDNLDRVVARFDDVEARAAVAAALADEIARNVQETSEELDRRMDAVSGAVVADRADTAAVRAELERGTEELRDTTRRLAHEIADLRTAAGKAEYVFDEVTARPFMADEAILATTGDDGRPALGFRDGPAPEPLYAGFEALFRGSPELVRERQRPYVELLASSGPVVDLGCGRGELLEMLAGDGVEARGVDVDPAMVDRARARGVDVELGDAVEWLGKQADGSLGAVFSAQVVEHLSTDDLVTLLRTALEKLRPGGLFVAETVNPHSPRALKAFWVDPTHVRPVFPETLLALCRLTGYAEAIARFPGGTGNLVEDLRTQGEYAVVARTPD